MCRRILIQAVKYRGRRRCLAPGHWRTFPLLVVLMLWPATTPWGETPAEPSARATEREESVYLFSYFVGNGEDGLHLAMSRDGLHWKALNEGRPFLAPKVGEQQLMRDPSIVQGPDGIFHMVWTAGWHERGIGHAYSKDLLDWSEQQYLPVMAHEPDAENCWAPELFYDKKEGLFYILWSTTIPGRFPETEQENGDHNHRIYFTTTRNFQDFADTKLFYDAGFNVIDAIMLDHGDRYYLFVKDETRHPPEKNIRYTTAPNPTGPFAPISRPLTGDYWAEGPSVLRVDDTWYLYFDKYRKNRYGALRSNDLMHWEDISDRVSFPDDMRHGTVFAVTPEVFERVRKMCAKKNAARN